jgi:hypothetical protein
VAPVADSLSFVSVGPLAGLVLVLTVPVVALIVLALMALWPARGAARLHTAEALRTEYSSPGTGAGRGLRTAD